MHVLMPLHFDSDFKMLEKLLFKLNTFSMTSYLLLEMLVELWDYSLAFLSVEFSVPF